MLTEQDLKKAAYELVRRHGRDALAIARRMVRRYVKAGDAGAVAEWKRLASLVERDQRV